MHQRDLFKLNFLYEWFNVSAVRRILLLGLRLIDLFTILMSVLVSTFIISHFSGSKISYSSILLFIFVVIISWIYLLELSYVPKVPRTTRYRIIFLEFFILNFISFLILLPLKYIIGLHEISVGHILVFLCVNQVFLFLMRLSCFLFFKHYRAKGYDLHNVMVIADQFSDEIIDKLIQNKDWGYRVLIIVTNSKLIRAKYWDKARIIHHLEDINKIIATDIIDEVIYCSSVLEKEKLEEIMLFCKQVGVNFTLSSSFSPLDAAKVQLDALYNSSTISFRFMPTNSFAMLMKSLSDLVFASVALLLASPVFLALGILIKLDSKGPVFFKQERIGLRGRKFYCYKFRTMVQNAESLRNNLEDFNEADGPVFKIKKDPRITKIGVFLRKTGLDELPQFYNVLKGEMSIMGPRPPLESEIVKYEPWQLRRLSVKPGITCIWQVTPNRNNVKFDHWVKMDLNYIDNWSLKLDFVLFFRTIFSMFGRQGY